MALTEGNRKKEKKKSIARAIEISRGLMGKLDRNIKDMKQKSNVAFDSTLDEVVTTGWVQFTHNIPYVIKIINIFRNTSTVSISILVVEPCKDLRNKK